MPYVPEDCRGGQVSSRRAGLGGNRPGVSTVGLGLHDSNAKDEQIIAELYTFPMVYRANIVR